MVVNEDETEQLETSICEQSASRYRTQMGTTEHTTMRSELGTRDWKYC